MHPARVLLVIAGVGATVTLVLPYLEAASTSNGVEARAWPAAALLMTVAMAVLFGDRREGFTPAGVALAVVVTGIAAIYAVAKAIDAVEAARAVRAMGSAASAGPGVWVLIAVSVIGMGGAVYGASRRVR